MSTNNPHYTILKSLYDLYLENKANPDVLGKVKAISWELEHSLDFSQYGYHELAELMTDEISGNKAEPEPHYIAKIEDSLARLSTED